MASTVRIEGDRKYAGFDRSNPKSGPSVSVITASYNASLTIEKTIKSIADQKYSNLEYIIIDGGSTDRTIDIINNYANVVNYWISEPDKGVYDALNKGIDLSHGDWIYFLGADDTLFDKNVLQNIFSRPLASKLVYGNVLRAATGVYDGEFTAWKLFYRNISQQAIFYHRDLFRLFGKFEGNRYPILADWLFNLRAFADKNTKPLFIDSIIATYSDTGMSVSNVDTAFFRDIEMNVRRLFGLWSYLRFKSNNVYIYLSKLIKNGTKQIYQF